MQEIIEINTEFITLGQLLKIANLFESGGMIKGYLQDIGVSVNGEIEHRRGRKLYDGTTVEVEEAEKSYLVKQVQH